MVNENNEPIHVHLSKGSMIANSTKIWLTKSGGYILANNNSKIPQNDLNKIIAVISRHYFFILAKWKEYYHIEDVKFYC